MRFTGMPAFGTGTRTEAGEQRTWQLVTFIRKLPSISASEIGWMESLNRYRIREGRLEATTRRHEEVSDHVVEPPRIRCLVVARPDRHS